MISPTMIDAYDIYKVVTAAELEQATRSGWRLAAIIEEQYAEVGNQASNYSYTDRPTVHVGLPAACTKAVYLVGIKADDDAWKKQKQEEVDALLQKLGAAKKQVESMGQLESRIRELEASFAERNKQLLDERTYRNKLEGDVAKIRKALGELRMKEIIG